MLAKRIGVEIPIALDLLAPFARQAAFGAGLGKKFVDATIWVIFPVFLVCKGATLTQIGWIVGANGFVWGGSQRFTGRLSDHVGRFWPNVLGMWISGALGLGLVADLTGALEATLWFVSISMFASRAVLLY